MNSFTKKALSKFSKLDEREKEKLVKSFSDKLSMMEKLVNNMQKGILLIKDKKAIYYNDQLSNFIEIDKDKEELSHFIRDEKILSFLEKSLLSYKDNIEDFSFQRGSEVIIIEIKLLEEDDDNFRIVILTDVTSIRYRELKNLRANQLASFTTLTASIAHEIKNPLTSISLNLQMIQRGLNKNSDKKKLNSYLSNSLSELDRLNTIVVDFLFAVKPMLKKLELKDVNDIILSVKDFIEKELDEKKIKIYLSLKEYLPKVKIDANLIRQALLNILCNAMQAKNKKGSWIKISTEVTKSELVITIEDNGKGMDDGTLLKIFEPYFTTKESGTGLGLTVVYKIIKEHDGDIKVFSKLKEGSKFVISLPIESSSLIQIEQRENKYES